MYILFFFLFLDNRGKIKFIYEYMQQCLLKIAKTV